MKLPYGLLAGQFVHITEVHSGSTGVQCPYCKKAVLAKKGKIKRHHFAHLGESCIANFTNSLFGLQGKLPTQLPIFLFSERKTKAIQDKLAHLNQQYQELEQQALDEKLLLPELYHNLEKLKEFYRTKQLPLKGSQIQELIRQVKKYTSQKIAPFPAFYMVKGPPFTSTYTDGKNNCTLEEIAKDTIATEYYYPIFFHKYVRCLENYQAYKVSAPEITSTRLLFQNELAYFKQFKLYFLEIHTEKGSFHKIGLTSRPIEVRMQEIEQDLKTFYQQVKLEVRFLIEHHAFLETFFKQKYGNYQMQLGSFTEYFHFPAPLLSSILLNFELVKNTATPPRDTLLWVFWAYHKSNKKIYGYSKKSIYVEGQKIILSEREVKLIQRILTSS